MWRKKPTGFQAIGWTQRLHCYSLASNSEPDLFNHLVWLDKITKKANIGEYLKCDSKRHATRCEIAKDILKWGGVTRGNIVKVPHVIDKVIDSAKAGTPSEGAPMNSGWTKIAAVYSLVISNAPTQIIWDSRVSLSICTRLGCAAKNLGLSPTELLKEFRGSLGWVPGRGGTRPSLMDVAKMWFPNRYAKWDAHFEGGSIVEDMTQILNANLITYGKPCEALSQQEHAQLEKLGIDPPDYWNPWLVACVLFMDGQ
jgi:hypothetical protein